MRGRVAAWRVWEALANRSAAVVTIARTTAVKRPGPARVRRAGMRAPGRSAPAPESDRLADRLQWRNGAGVP